MSRLARRRLGCATSAILLAIAGAAWAGTPEDPRAPDPMLDGDVVDPDTGRPAVIVPLAPWVQRGPDGVLGTPDDVVETEVRGDVDLVVRSGRLEIGPEIPPPTAATGALPVGRVGLFGGATPIPFVVVPTDGQEPAPVGSPVIPPYFEGLPVLVLAFADLDGDGFVGVTHLDGDPSDSALEGAELSPVGMRYALGSKGVASGELVVSTGGPAQAPARIALAAVAFAGPQHKKYLKAIVPDGPAVMTRLPFLPYTDPVVSIRQGLFGLLRADPEGRVAIQIDLACDPDPSDPRLGEAFTLRLDGSDPTIDVALVHSGELTHFGAARRPDPASYVPLAARPLKPGIDADGRVGAFEVPGQIGLPDDGEATATALRIVPLDRLGNFTTPQAPALVRLRTGGVVSIVSPDLDGDPFEESVWVSDTRGTEIVLDDAGGAFDDPRGDRLVLEANGRTSRVELVLADPDVDDDGLVDEHDLKIFEDCGGIELGDRGFNPLIDLDGNGRLDDSDLAAAIDWLGAAVAADAPIDEAKRKIRGWKPGKAKRPKEAQDVKEIRKAWEKREKRLAKFVKKAKHRKHYCDWKAPK